MLTGREVDPLSAQLVADFFPELGFGKLFDLGFITFANHDDQEPASDFHRRARLVFLEAGYGFLNQRGKSADLNFAWGTRER